MAEEVQYASGADSNKRKYDDTAALTTASFDGGRKTTGFSSPDSAAALPASGIESAKQRAQEIASRLFNDAEAKRSKVDDGDFDSAASVHFDQKPLSTNAHVASTTPSLQDSYGYQGTSKRIDIPNGRVGVIIGKGGETIKYLQLQSGAKIQVTRDMDADPNSPTRMVELMGTPDQITKAEQLIHDVLAEAEAGGSVIVSRRLTGQTGSEQFSMKIPNNKVGLVIGKGGETIKNIQARSGAHVQVIPLHLPPGDTSAERTVQIDGSTEQIEAAKQLVNEVISENRLRNSTAGGYPQQGYQARGPTGWGPGPTQVQQQQQAGYGYMQPGPYPGPQYSGPRPHYPGYPQQTGAGYPTNWDQSSAAPAQQPPQGAGYDYYNQPPPQQQQASGVAPSTDNSYYNYNQPPTSGYTSSHQTYPQDGYGGGYPTSAPSLGYSQPPPNPHQGYDQQQGYSNPAPSYGNTTKPPTDGHASYGTQGEAGQAPPPPQASPLGQQGYYMGQHPTTGSGQPGYAAAPTSQPGYGNQPPTQGGYATGYGGPPPPQGHKPSADPSAYGQPQQSPSQGYTNSQAPPPAHSGYAQLDPAAPRVPPPTGYGAAPAQPGAYPAYAQQPPAYVGGLYGSPYSQAPVYPPVDGNAGSGGAAGVGASPAVQPNVAAKAPAPESK